MSTAAPAAIAAPVVCDHCDQPACFETTIRGGRVERTCRRHLATDHAAAIRMID